MKLHYVQTLFIAFILLVATSIWGALFYWQMLDEIQDSLDDGLKNTALQIAQFSDSDSIPNEVHTWDARNYLLIPVSNPLFTSNEIKDTLMYHANEDDLEPMRVLTTYIQHPNQQWYLLQVVTSTVEEDDLMEDLGWGLLWFYLGTLSVFFLLYMLFSRYIWKPFYTILQYLRAFNISQSHKTLQTHTRIQEFQTLQSEVNQLTQRVHNQFTSQKQFIENVAHELQTPLAIALSKVEHLSGAEDITENQAHALESIHTTLLRLSSLNRSLLLLSKIENNQFPHTQPTSFSPITTSLLTDFEDLAEFKTIQIQWNSVAEFSPTIHPELAHILVSNLLKNAISHAPKHSTIRIEQDASYWFIENQAEGAALDSALIFNRFATQSKQSQSTGLGLAIAQSIVQQFNLVLRYDFIENKHRFTISKHA